MLSEAEEEAEGQDRREGVGVAFGAHLRRMARVRAWAWAKVWVRVRVRVRVRFRVRTHQPSGHVHAARCDQGVPPLLARAQLGEQSSRGRREKLLSGLRRRRAERSELLPSKPTADKSSTSSRSVLGWSLGI